MDFKVTVILTASAELMAVLSGMFSRAIEPAAPVVRVEPEKTVEVPPTETEPEAPETEPETPAVTLSEIRAWVKNHPETREKSKKALADFGATSLRDLPAEKYDEYFQTIQRYE